MPIPQITNIRHKLLIPYLGSLLIILTTTLWSLSAYNNKQLKVLTNDISQKLHNDFNASLEEDIELFQGLLFLISENDNLRSLWKAKNKNGLIQESLPIYSELNKKHHVTHFYFHNLDGTNFLRVHAPNKFGDTIQRQTFLKAVENQEIAAGLEFGVFGEFVLRVVIPWKIDGELIGYLELGEEINHILAKLSDSNKYHLVLNIEKKYITQNNLDQTTFFKNRQKQLNLFENIFIINKTILEIPDYLKSAIDKKTNQSLRKHINTEHKTLSSNIKIPDFEGNDIAKLTYIVDIADNLDRHSDTSQKIAAYIITTGIISFIFYFIYSQRIQRSIQTIFHQITSEIKVRKSAQNKLKENKKRLEKLVIERDQSLEESKRRYQTLFDKTADALLIIEGSNFIDCNQATLDMLGYATKEELYNTHPSKLSPEFQPDGQPSESKANLMIQTAFEQGSHRFEWDHKRKNGEIFPVEVLLTAIPFEGSQLLHVVWRDITERKKAAAEIEYQAYYDSLTNLPNRKLLLDRLKQALTTSVRHNHFGALMFIDLDRFKTINDSLGHTIGDKLIIESANRIKNSTWDEDTVSRFGGDEYLVLLRHIGDNKESACLHAEKVASRILDKFNTPFMIEGHELHVTTSIGITIFPIDQHKIEDIIKHADTAMYSAKENGRNQTAFYIPEMHEKVINRLTLEKDLRSALKKKQLTVYYQPQINITGQITGVEALLRWKHPDKGFISTDEFIAIAGDTGSIYEIGDFVLEQAITDINEINKVYSTKISLSVNISPKQFSHPDFLRTIKHLTENYSLEKNFLTLEVTERIAIQNLNEAFEKFSDLKHTGVRISLDDFGTGYSSLSHLKRLPIDELKIDKSFIFDIEEDPQDALLVKTILNIAQQFGLETVAEGVETLEQISFLKGQNCGIYQGYYYSRPLPLESLIEFLDENKKGLQNEDLLRTT